jgi:hypothetical protein
MSEWNDRKKFWAETWRSVVLGGVGALIAILVLGNLNDEAKFKRENRVKALDNFIYKSSLYTAVAADFCSDSADDVERRFKSETVDDYHVATGALKIYFQDQELDSKFDEAKEREKALFALCNTHGQKPDKNEWEPKRQALIAANIGISQYALSKLGRWWVF